MLAGAGRMFFYSRRYQHRGINFRCLQLQELNCSNWKHAQYKVQAQSKLCKKSFQAYQCPGTIGTTQQIAYGQAHVCWPHSLTWHVFETPFAQRPVYIHLSNLIHSLNLQHMALPCFPAQRTWRWLGLAVQLPGSLKGMAWGRRVQE